MGLLAIVREEHLIDVAVVGGVGHLDWVVFLQRKCPS